MIDNYEDLCNNYYCDVDRVIKLQEILWESSECNGVSEN